MNMMIINMNVNMNKNFNANVNMMNIGVSYPKHTIYSLPIYFPSIGFNLKFITMKP